MKCATEITQICLCVFRFQFDVSPDDQAQQAGRQQQFERWDVFSASTSTSTLLFLNQLNPSLHLSLSDSAWQYGSPGFQELKAEVTEVPAPDGSEDNTGLC